MIITKEGNTRMRWGRVSDLRLREQITERNVIKQKIMKIIK